MDLTRLLQPRSVAVVGATERPGSYGGEALLNLQRLGGVGVRALGGADDGDRARVEQAVH